MFLRERKKKFDLYYYDGLSRQEDEIRLTIGMYNVGQYTLRRGGVS